MTTNFDEWLGNFSIDDIEELVALYHAVENKRSEGFFNVQEKKDGWIVSYPGGEEELLIANEQARRAFLGVFCAKFGDVEFKDAILRNQD